MFHAHRRVDIDEQRHIVACRQEPGKTGFYIHNGMCLTRIKLSDEALRAMCILVRDLDRDQARAAGGEG